MEVSAKTDPNLREERASFGKKHPSVNGGTSGCLSVRGETETGRKKGLGLMKSHNMNGRSFRVTEIHGHEKHLGVKCATDGEAKVFGLKQNHHSGGR